ncbi:MAG TPA: IS21 family transposase [Nocardioidaceae bacterium]|nr:IS21 family transposase [Nocardioidaceae bacterium]
MLTARKTMDVVAAFRDVGTYRGAAEICGVDPKTVKRKVLAHEAGELDEQRARRASVPKNTDVARGLVAQRVEATKAKITAKRLLVEARADGYAGSARNFRRLVAEEKKKWRARNGRQRRPAVWTPGDTVVIDWGTLPGTGVHVFCAVLAWSRVRFVRYARDETAATTFAMLAECFEALGGVPAKVLADRMGCLKAGTVAGVVIPTPDYVRFATHYGFSPDFCHAGDPASKGIVENLVGYAKRDVPTPDAHSDLAVWNEVAVEWCAERNGLEHSEICAIPTDRLAVEVDLLRPLPTLRPRIGRAEIRKVDKLATIRVASARYSVPSILVGSRVEAVTYDQVVRIYRIDTGEHVATHDQLGPGESSILDEHYPTPRKPPSRGPRARTQTERTFLALGEHADAFIRAGAAAGMTMLPKEIETIVNELLPAHGDGAVTRALERAVRFSRFRADDVRSILAIGPAAPEPVDAGDQVVIDLPAVEQRGLDAYRVEGLA